MSKSQLNSLDKLLNHLSEDQLTKGKKFEYACKWFLQNDSVYAQELKHVWLWDEYPGRWGRDKGIDLVAQDYQDKIWAIQVKAYDDNPVTKEDVDTFLSESNRQNISFRLLIATTNKVSANAREVFAGQEKPAQFLLKFDLEKSDIDWMLFVTHAKSKTPIIKTPREHQEQALRDIIQGFENHDRGQVHMACGTGKSLLGLWLAQHYVAKYTLVLVPSISLVSQLRREWAKNRGDFVFDSIFVCSDDTVGYNKDHDKYDILDIGFPATTSAEALVEQVNYNDRPKVIFSTYHSSAVIQQACELKKDLLFDLVIADEAHRCVGKARSYFAMVTDDNKIRAYRKLYMTATPRIFNAATKSKLKEYECEIICMDDEKKFGPVFYSFSFSDAIKQNLLTDYQVVIAVMNHDEYRSYAERGRFIHFNDHETDARTVASQLLLAKAIQQYDLKKVITFHNGVSAAQDFIETLPQTLQLLPENNLPVIDYRNVVHGELSQKDREIILDNFSNPEFKGTVIIGNDRCLREGVDIPALDGIVFVDPKNSEVDIIQAVGRAIRLSDNKKVGTIIIPLFIDVTKDGVVEIEDSCFKKVWAIMRALRAHDNILAEELDNIRIELGKRSYKAPSKLPSKIIVDVPIAIDHDFAEQLTVKLIDGVIQNCTDGWDERFGELIRFKEEFGHCNVPHDYEKNQQLGNWVGMQRYLCKSDSSRLTMERKQKLNSIGFCWEYKQYNWRPYESAREWVMKLNLISETDWRKYISGEMLFLLPLPNDIPRAPWVVYKNKGWINWGHFLGTNIIAPRFKKYLSYYEACIFARSLNLKKKDDWFMYIKGEFKELPLLPDDIPCCPDKTYKRKDYGCKWTGWGNFLGTERISNQKKAKNYRSYEDAHIFAKSLNLTTAKEWLWYIKGEYPHLPILPHDIPRKPDASYEEWINWPTFLGCIDISKYNSKRSFWSFLQARDFARSLCLFTQKDWFDYCAGKFLYLPIKPLEVPAAPNKKYKKLGWKGYKDWLRA